MRGRVRVRNDEGWTVREWEWVEVGEGQARVGSESTKQKEREQGQRNTAHHGFVLPALVLPQHPAFPGARAAVARHPLLGRAPVFGPVVGVGGQVERGGVGCFSRVEGLPGAVRGIEPDLRVGMREEEREEG